MMTRYRYTTCRDTATALAMIFVLAACAVVQEPEPPPRRRAVAMLTATPSPTATPRTPLDESPADEVPEGPGRPPQEGGLPKEGPAPTNPEPESMLTRISTSTPPNVAAAYRLIEEGRKLMARGDRAQALHRLERSVAIDPMNPYGYYFLAQVHSQSNAYDQAIAFAGRAAALSARTDRVCESRAYTLQGTVYEQSGRFADARTAYAKALRSDPRNAAARLGLGRLGQQ